MSSKHINMIAIKPSLAFMTKLGLCNMVKEKSRIDRYCDIIHDLWELELISVCYWPLQLYWYWRVCCQICRLFHFIALWTEFYV